MKSTVLRFERASLPEAKSLVVQAPSTKEVEPHKLFQTPLPTINVCFDDDANPVSSSTPGVFSGPAPAFEVTAALESMPHLLSKIQSLWKSRDLNTFIAQLFLDTRDGDRAGFPFVVAQELFFLAKINLLVRAEEAAQILGISVAEAISLVSQGDQLAQGHSNSKEDVWAQHVANAAQPNPVFFAATENHARTSAPKLDIANFPRQVSAKLSAFLKDAPPLPPSVRLDVTTPKVLRSVHGGQEEGGIMDKGLFRCLAKELGNLNIGQLVLSSLGNTEQCDWLPAGIRFARMHCAFEKIVLHVDLLSASETLLRQCISDGTNHLVIYLNLASSKWRSQAQAVAADDPEYFQREIMQLISFRDELQSRTGHRCELSVASTSRRSMHALNVLFNRLNELPGLIAYSEVLLPPGVTPLDAGARGGCHCLAPFIEAHVRTNGHLVACAQDHSGYSFTADLTKTTFTDAWLGQAFRMARQRVAKGEPAGRLCDICPHHHAEQIH